MHLALVRNPDVAKDLTPLAPKLLNLCSQAAQKPTVLSTSGLGAAAILFRLAVHDEEVRAKLATPLRGEGAQGPESKSGGDKPKKKKKAAGGMSVEALLAAASAGRNVDALLKKKSGGKSKSKATDKSKPAKSAIPSPAALESKTSERSSPSLFESLEGQASWLWPQQLTETANKRRGQCKQNLFVACGSRVARAHDPFPVQSLTNAAAFVMDITTIALERFSEQFKGFPQKAFKAVLSDLQGGASYFLMVL